MRANKSSSSRTTWNGNCYAISARKRLFCFGSSHPTLSNILNGNLDKTKKKWNTRITYCLVLSSLVSFSMAEQLSVCCIVPTLKRVVSSSPCRRWIMCGNIKKKKRSKKGRLWEWCLTWNPTFVLHWQRSGLGTTLRSQRFPNVRTTSQQDPIFDTGI